VGTKIVTVVGTVGSFSATTSFNVYITNNCTQSSTISSVAVTGITYSTSDANTSISYTSWTTTYSFCGSLIYTAALSNGTALPSFI
jgi:hypothetical protein